MKFKIHKFKNTSFYDRSQDSGQFGERWWMERDMGVLWGARHVMIFLWV